VLFRSNENLHVTAPDQRFATDLLIRKADASHAGAGKANTDYYCFGQPVLAPSDGAVVAVIDTVTDNIPGAMNRQQPLGNHVILDHGHGEFSFLCHFQKGSARVKTGQKVHTGQVLGLCGNSGNSSEPHVHYHMQNTSLPFKGEGLPAQFLRYSANGETIERGEPKQGQTVAALDPVPVAPVKKPAKRGGAAKAGKAAP
jgi:murein DD-endopeptidase MepM/ murein hydrolase activator NlpD